MLTRLLPLVVALALLVPACGDDDGEPDCYIVTGTDADGRLTSRQVCE